MLRLLPLALLFAAAAPQAQSDSLDRDLVDFELTAAMAQAMVDGYEQVGETVITTDSGLDELFDLELALGAEYRIVAATAVEGGLDPDIYVMSADFDPVDSADGTGHTETLSFTSPAEGAHVINIELYSDEETEGRVFGFAVFRK